MNIDTHDLQRIESVLGRLARLLARSPEEIEREALESLRRTVDAARSAPFHAARLSRLRRDFTLPEFEALPELTRTDLREHQRPLLATSCDEEPLADSTGGSTGTPTPFFRTFRHRQITRAVDLLTASWVGGGLGKRSVVLWGAQMDVKSSMTLRKRLSFAWSGGSYLIDCFRVDARKLEHARRIIALYRPQIVRGYRSILLELGRHLEQRSAHLHPRPRAILSAAERLLPEHRATLERTLGAPVYDRYGSREMGLAAAECRSKRLHVMTPSVRFEVVSERGVNVPGEAGRVVVTPLNNYAMPLLRYDIGDRAIWHGHGCDCGLPLPVVSMTYGRNTELIRLPTGRSVYLVFFHMHLRFHARVRGWQLIREDDRRFELRLALDGPLEPSVVSSLERDFSAYLGDPCSLRLTSYLPLEGNRTGKVELFIDRRSTRGPCAS